MQAQPGTEGVSQEAETAPFGLVPLEAALARGFTRERLDTLVRSREISAFRGKLTRRIYFVEAELGRAAAAPPARPPEAPAARDKKGVPVSAPAPEGRLRLEEVRTGVPVAPQKPPSGRRASEKPPVEPAFHASVLLVLGALIVALHVPLRPSSPLGQVFGLLAATSLFASYIYPVRKHLRWPAGWRLSSVLRFHTRATIVGATFAVLHGGLHYGPNVATAASALLLLLVASGLFGNYLYVHAIALPEKVNGAARLFSSALLRVPLPSGFRPVFSIGTDSGRNQTSSRRIPPGATRFARALQVWRFVHGTVSYFFLVVLAAHVIVALCYRGNVLWSLVLAWLRRS
jgi:hypothetical protein